MNRVIHFKNGSKIEILPVKEPKRSKRSEEQMKQIITSYKKSPYEFAKYIMRDTWNNLYLYQKLYMKFIMSRQGELEGLI